MYFLTISGPWSILYGICISKCERRRGLLSIRRSPGIYSYIFLDMYLFLFYSWRTPTTSPLDCSRKALYHYITFTNSFLMSNKINFKFWYNLQEFYYTAGTTLFYFIAFIVQFATAYYAKHTVGAVSELLYLKINQCTFI